MNEKSHDFVLHKTARKIIVEIGKSRGTSVGEKKSINRSFQKIQYVINPDKHSALR